MRLWKSWCVGVLAASSASAQSTFVQPDEFGWSRGDSGATYYEWNDFSLPRGMNEPDIAAIPSEIGGISASLQDLAGMAFVTSTGNLYSSDVPLDIEIVVPVEAVAGGTTTVLLQVSTLGVEIDPDTLVIGALGPVETQELFRFNLGPDGIGGGDFVETLWRFEVPSEHPLVIRFMAEAASLSIAALSVDTFSEGRACLADVDLDGDVTLLDFTAFLSAFAAGDARADQDLDGGVSLLDFTAFLSNFVVGCEGG